MRRRSRTRSANSVSIRPATIDDFPRLMVIRAAVRENLLSDPGRVTLRDYRDHLGPAGRTWVHQEGGEILGFSAATRASATIWALFVHPDHEGRGIGRGLLGCAVDWLWSQGATQVQLSTSAGTRAEGFYRSAGWRAAGIADGEIRFTLAAPARGA
jgi:GNAT superfamily N-acetyltransferase